MSLMGSQANIPLCRTESFLLTRHHHSSQEQNLMAQSKPDTFRVQGGNADPRLLRAEPSPAHCAKSQMFLSLFRNPHPKNSHLGCWHLFNSEKCQNRGFFKPSWIIPFFLGQVIPGHSPAASKKKGKQDTRRTQTQGVCSSSASILKRLTGMLVWLPLDWDVPLPLLGLGSGPDEEVAALGTQLEVWTHLGGGFCLLPPLQVHEKLL